MPRFTPNFIKHYQIVSQNTSNIFITVNCKNFLKLNIKNEIMNSVSLYLLIISRNTDYNLQK